MLQNLLLIQLKNFVNKNAYRTLKELELNIIDSLGDDKKNNDMKKNIKWFQKII